MKKSLINIKKEISRRYLVAVMAGGLLAGMTVWGSLEANHPVLVEGNNCADGGPNVTTVPPGTCGDFDGDGRIGTAEDTDNATDRIFGTITAALGAANNGANQNGRVTIVTSGRFPEVVSITAANGNVTLEAAPDVEANIDAVLSGDAGNAARQGAPGIIINAPIGRRVVIRNIVSRNWSEGIMVIGDSHVTIDKCRVENNRDYGIHVSDNASAVITHCQVNATGFRQAPGVDNNPNPGIGIVLENNATGGIAFTTVTGSFAAGISGNVSVDHSTVCDNNPNIDRGGRGSGGHQQRNCAQSAR